MHFGGLFSGGDIVLNNFLHCRPPASGDQSAVFSYGDYPLIGGTAGSVLFFIVPLIVRQKSESARTVFFVEANIGVYDVEVQKRVFVRSAVCRVLQYLLYSGQGEKFTAAGAYTPAYQIFTDSRNALQFNKFIEDRVYCFKLCRYLFKLAGSPYPAVDNYFAYLFRSVPKGGSSTEPAAGPRKHEHIVADALCNSLAFELCKYRGYVHHGFSHGLGGVELLLYANKRYAPFVELLDKSGKVADIAAYTVKPVADKVIGSARSHIREHLTETRSVGVFGGKALVLVNSYTGAGNTFGKL